MNQIVIQIIGGIGYTLLALSYLKKEKRQILFMQIIAYIAFTIHYYLLSGVTGAICNLIGLISLLIIYLFDKHKLKSKNILIFCLVPFIVIIAMITYEDIYSIFPIVASVIAVISFLTDNEIEIRRIGIVCASCWLIYAIVYKSYVAIIFEVVTFISIIYANLKLRISKRRCLK